MFRSGRPRALFEATLREAIDGATDVLDVGTSQRFAKELRACEGWFAGRRYIAAGYEPGQGFGAYNCDVHEDIEAMTFPAASFDAVLCLEVLEHVRHPDRAAGELQRVLRPGGTLFLTTPFLTSYHGKGGTSHSHDAYPDFWRFTHEGLMALFGGLNELRVVPLDGPLAVRAAMLGLPPRFEGALRGLLDRIDRPSPGRAASRHLLFGRR